MFRQLSQIALALLLVEAITWRSWPVTTVVVNVRAFGAKGDCQHVSGRSDEAGLSDFDLPDRHLRER